MNKYHNRNRIFSPIMTIHDILTLHNKNSLSFFPPSLSFLLSFFLSFLSFSLLSLPFLLYLPSLPLCFLCLLS